MDNHVRSSGYPTTIKSKEVAQGALSVWLALSVACMCNIYSVMESILWP